MSKYLYLDRNTFFHRLDPRTKLLLTLAHFIASAALVEQLWLGGFVVFETLLLTTLSRSWKNIRKIRIILIPLALMTLLSWLIFGTGTTPLFWIIKKEDLCQGISSVFRSMSSIIMAIVLLSTTRNEELVQGCVKFGLPYRGAFAFSNALRMTPHLTGVAMTVVAAQKSRGLDLDNGGFWMKLKKTVPLVVPAVLLGLRSADTMTMAVEAKGFGYTKKRSNYMELHLTGLDWALIIYAVLLSVGSIVISANGWFAVYNAL